MQRRAFLLGTLGSAWLAAQQKAGSLGVLAYVQSDGIWLRDLPDGRPRRIAAGGNIQRPRFSPSGHWIAYTMDEVVYVASSDGRQMARLDGSNAQWRADRDHLIVEQETGLNLFSAANAWGTPAWSIAGGQLPVVFSPNAAEMAYADEAEISGVRSGRLCCVTTAQPAESPRVVAMESGNGIIPYRWMGDTRELLYWLDEDFSASAKSDGLQLFRVPVLTSAGAQRSLGITTLVNEDFLSLAPGADALAVAAGGGRDACEDKRIARIEWPSGEVRYLTDKLTAAVSPAWSPDGNSIAYSAAPAVPNGCGGGERMREALAKRRIWTIDAAGSSRPTALTGEDRYRDEEPQWSPDGRHLLFCRIDDARNQTVWLMRSDGTGAEQVAGPLDANNADDADLAWFGYYGTIDWGARIDWQR